VFDIAVRHVLTSHRPFEVVLDGIYGGISQPDIGALFAGLAAWTAQARVSRQGCSLVQRRGGNRSVIPDTTLREAEMSSTQQHSTIPSTAVEFAPGLWRTSLQRYDLSVPGHEMIQSRVDVEPGSPPIRHTHPGEEIIYVLAGSLEYQIDGQPTKVYNAGEALTVPAGAIHAVRNTGTGNAAELATYVVEKGKPLLTVAQ
jgi:quercetin dioxygenase-like cupin family protein